MRAACGGNTIYFGPAAENTSMAFEQNTNHAMEIAGNCLYLQFQRAHTRPCGCGRRFMLGFASPALLGTKRVEQIRASDLCAPVVAARRRGGLPHDKATMESFSPESLRKSREAWAPQGESSAPRNRDQGGEPAPRAQPPRSQEPPPHPTPNTHSSFSCMVSSTSTLRDSFYL